MTLGASSRLVDMKEKDKQILKDSSLAIADQLVSLVPGLNLAWGLSKALYGAGLKLRVKRAVEWVEMIRDNTSILTKAVLGSDSFQDGFVFALEYYIRERNEDKRKYMKSIFLGFCRTSYREQFELERMYHVLSILNPDDIVVLKDVDTERVEFHQVYEKNSDRNENIYNLVGSGLLMADYSARIGSIAAPFVRITSFGKKFIDYIRTC